MAVLTRVPEPALGRKPASPKATRALTLGVLSAYSILIAVVILRHEPWFDEAQAWMIARDLNPFNMFEVLPYEGQPGLWPFLLMAPARLLPYQAVNIISGMFGALATYLLVKHSPFPTVLKVILPFTFFLFFQYSVVARSYSLMAPLMFWLAILYPNRQARPIRFAAVLFLHANATALGFVVAGSIMTINLCSLLRNRRELDRRTIAVNLGTTACLFVGMLGLSFLMRPPEDRTFAPKLSFDAEGDLRAVWDMMNGGLTGSLGLSVLVIGLSLWFFWRTKVLSLYLLPTLLTLVFLAVVHNALWHQGILFLIWIFAMWVGLQDRPAIKLDRFSLGAAVGALSMVCVIQIGWSAQAALMDVSHPYSGSRDIAGYLKANMDEGDQVFATHWAAMAVNPYFRRNIYANYNSGDGPSYWWWSHNSNINHEPDFVERRAPRYVVDAVKIRGGESWALGHLDGYRLTAVFPGNLYWKDSVVEPDVYLLLERRTSATRKAPTSLWTEVGSADFPRS